MRISPMLLTESAPHESPDYIYELKFDGVRGVAYLGDRTFIRNKRNKDVDRVYPELLSIHRSVSERCILDGEILVFSGGVPDFFSIQKRALMSNPIKIALAVNKIPVTFVAFDILYLNGKDLTPLPLIERKRILYETVTESPRLNISRHIESGGMKLFEAARAKELEGVVAKVRTSLYHQGIHSKEWLKFKALLDDDFVIIGYRGGHKPVSSLELAAYDSGALVYQGSVSFGPYGEEQTMIMNAERADSPLFNLKGPGIIFLKPALCCTVKYMQRTEGNFMRQAVLKCLRPDKTPAECFLRKPWK